MENEQKDGPNGTKMDPNGKSSTLDEDPEKNLEFMGYVYNLAKQIKELCQIDKTINLRNNLNEYKVFVLELKTFLTELGCPYRALINSDLEVAITSKNTRQILLNYLTSKLELAKKIKNSFPVEDPMYYINYNEIDYQALSKFVGFEVDRSCIKELVKELNKMKGFDVTNFFFKRKRTSIQGKDALREGAKEDQGEQHNISDSRRYQQNTYHPQSTPSKKKDPAPFNPNKRVTQHDNINTNYDQFNQGGRFYGENTNYRNWQGQGYRHPDYSHHPSPNFNQNTKLYEANEDPMRWNMQRSSNGQNRGGKNLDSNNVTFYNNSMDQYKPRHEHFMLPNQIGPISQVNDILIINYNQGYQPQLNIQNQAFGIPQFQEGYSSGYNIHSPLSYPEYNPLLYHNSFSPIQFLYDQSEYSYGLNQGHQPQMVSQNQIIGYTDRESYEIEDYNRNSKFKNIWTKGSSSSNSASQKYDESARNNIPNYQANDHGYGLPAQATQQVYPNVHGEYMTYR